MTNPSGLAPLTASPGADFPEASLVEDFDAAGLPKEFWPYAGKSGDTEEGGSLHVQWAPAHDVCLGDSLLRLKSFWDTTGTQPMIINAGAGTAATWTYGAFFVRMKRTFNIPADHLIELLFPKVGWPPEVDIDEDAGTNESESATVHYSPGNQQIQHTEKGVDATQWHTYGCLWSPGLIIYTIDGEEWARVESDEVPTVAMWLGIQSEYEGAVLAAATAETDEVDVDWITVFPYVPATVTAPPATIYGDVVYASKDGGKTWEIAGYTEISDPTGNAEWHAA